MKIEKEKASEFLFYLFFGISTTIVNILIYQILLSKNIDYRISNLLAIVIAKLYAYITNKLFVFRSHCVNLKSLLSEILRFFVARGFTGLIDYFGLIIAVSYLNADKLIAKYILQGIVIVTNYILSKFIIFKQAKQGE
ncbi:MAG: GtrA family protein [Hungatella hathewayi]|uniref:GtrA family protein n=1 Tax=Hungatella TaxID=1649459 RepID=UPI001486AF11|nr:MULTISPECIES: GtrA family protein [Hungatella]MCI7382757.1 GtrA family protein [Hungatella sp.]MDY6236589.1 GtrA family protein [Hungatella hathewayi]